MYELAFAHSLKAVSSV